MEGGAKAVQEWVGAVRRQGSVAKGEGSRGVMVADGARARARAVGGVWGTEVGGASGWEVAGGEGMRLGVGMAWAGVGQV